ncbi:dTDP-4-dehydrorhamnose 3,5-epimerase family protein [Rhizobium sp. YJ-22]|uniref:dTDP-4-dehydrorhamnose 3,5-epimerase family protein n=1 Tax=Rhizobium sp. YJ-22 TaxID=3037556 RepID=UPI0024121AAC|nr:dTDP-4-dehydrorhamnose 3,5-epimerase family protein [Rhizobium sp. YJ-22]MDG3575279.1 dTDP-4-dehydrorhamnose 3,5-epimerase family protein [Rhizobium sp. YJ-22]
MSGRFTLLETPMAGLHLVERLRLGDERGFLTRLFCAEELADLGFDGPVAQINETGTDIAGTVRGMHYQLPPFAEIKLVTCVAGAVLDVAIDLRRGSPSFLQHFATELSADNTRSLLIPRGFAHGFQTLTSGVRMVYAHSSPYRAESEAGLNAQDPALRIDWPLPPVNLSARDQSHPFLTSEFSGVAA